VVARGETLARIAQRYNMTIDQLVQMNNITDVNRILVGQRLTVSAPAQAQPVQTLPISAEEPTAAQAAPADQTVTHVVQRGEYLSQIAQRYGVDWPSIARANSITSPDSIYAGQRLVIPNAGEVTGAQAVSVTLPVGTPPTPPAAVVLTGKSVIVDLSDSYAYAYVNGVLQFQSIASTGLWATPTVQGDFNVYLMYESQTMSGPGYYLTGVPYVAYFYQGYALHGTYWHNNFGQPMSHGCVNLPTENAKLFYEFVEIGTPVRVQA
jgi:lipoprotein-anchoring transpeptidase ErfK/SrfK